jgi:hypothetical protein
MPWVTMHQDLFEYVSLQIVKEERLGLGQSMGGAEERLGGAGEVRGEK